MTERGLRLKLGAFIGGTLAILAGLVVFFGRAPDLFSNKARYDLLFPEAPGIAPGTPIRKSGVPIGQVTAIDLDPDSGQVRVAIRIDRKYLPRKNEEPTITKGILSGDVAIDFLPKLDDTGQPIPRGDIWPPGSTIPGVPPITPRSLLTPASGVIANAQQSLDRLAKAFERLERLERLGPKMEIALDEFTGLAKDARVFIPELKKTNQRFQNLLGSDAPAPPGPGAPPPGPGAPPPGPGGVVAAPLPDDVNIKVLIRDIQELVRSVRPTVDDIHGMVRKLEPDVTGAVRSARQVFENANDALSPENRQQFSELLRNANGVAIYIVKISGALTTMLEAAEKTIKNIDNQVTAAGTIVGDVRAITKPLAVKSESLVASVTDSAEQLNKALAEVRVLLQAFGKGNGTIQKLLADPTVYQNLDDAAGSLARVMSRAEKISRDLEVFADKIARRPELIGVGGAFRPSSGLKDLPGAPLPAYRTDWPPAVPARPTDGTKWSPPPIQGYPPR
jgi:phospholipid/cholesterol/gamma-HCH transport system substrate-binding protein